MTRIIIVYLNDDNFQQIIKIKKYEFQRIFVNIIKIDIRLKFDDYEIQNNDFL